MEQNLELPKFPEMIEKKKFLSRKIYGIPTLAFVILGIVLVGAVATWILTQTTTINLAPFMTPTISEDITLNGIAIGSIGSYSVVVTNDNQIPLVSVMNLKVLVNGLIVDNPEVFAVVDGLAQVTIGLDSSYTYIIDYTVAESYIVGEIVKITEPSDTIQIKAEPTLSQQI